MKINEVSPFGYYDPVIDNVKGLGSTPNNQEVDYLGLRVKMSPLTFLNLAQFISVDEMHSREYFHAALRKGDPFAAPFLIIRIPDEWEAGDFTNDAKVVGHEGRHRMRAFFEMGGNMPVETHLFFGSRQRARHLTPDIIKHLNEKMIPEDRRIPVKGPLFDLISPIKEGTERTVHCVGCDGLGLIKGTKQVRVDDGVKSVNTTYPCKECGGWGKLKPISSRKEFKK